MSRMRFVTLSLVILIVAVTLLGCVRRTITITTEPPHAVVVLNDQEIGRSEVTADFCYYGDYDVVIRKEGYKTLKTHWDIKAPWYQVFPLDFVAEVLWAWEIRDTHSRHFELEKQVLPTREDLLERAEEMRNRALDTSR